MLLISGDDPNPVALELWRGKVLRSFEQPDGRKRAGDLFAQMVPSRDRHMVYPARDERVMRIVRKVVRGLCHHHQLLSPVLDGEVWADHHRYEIPPAILAGMTGGHVEEDIFDYKYMVIDDAELHSAWLLRFFQRVGFMCLVFQSIEARDRIESGQQ
jgi:hypothetical protein